MGIPKTKLLPCNLIYSIFITKIRLITVYYIVQLFHDPTIVINHTITLIDDQDKIKV